MKCLLCATVFLATVEPVPLPLSIAFPDSTKAQISAKVLDLLQHTRAAEAAEVAAETEDKAAEAEVVMDEAALAKVQSNYDAAIARDVNDKKWKWRWFGATVLLAACWLGPKALKLSTIL